MVNQIKRQWLPIGYAGAVFLLALLFAFCIVFIPGLEKDFVERQETMESAKIVSGFSGKYCGNYLGRVDCQYMFFESAKYETCPSVVTVYRSDDYHADYTLEENSCFDSKR